MYCWRPTTRRTLLLMHCLSLCPVKRTPAAKDSLRPTEWAILKQFTFSSSAGHLRIANKKLGSAASPSFASGMFLRRLSETWQTTQQTQMHSAHSASKSGRRREKAESTGGDTDWLTNWSTDCVWGLNPDPHLEPGQSRPLGSGDPSEGGKQLPWPAVSKVTASPTPFSSGWMGFSWCVRCWSQ